jgi:hypothetical protein
MEPDRLEYDRPTACVIAQQYSSSTFLSHRVHSRKEKFFTLFERVSVSIFFFYFLNSNIMGASVFFLLILGIV